MFAVCAFGARPNGSKMCSAARRQPDATILDQQQHAVALGCERHADLTPVRRVLGGVVEQVGRDLLDPVRIEEGPREAFRDLQADHLSRIQWLPRHRLPHQGRQVDAPPAQGQLTALQP